VKTSRIARAVQFGALILALALVPAALAAKGGNGGGRNSDPSSINVVMVNDLNGNRSPNWGDTISFAVSSTATSSPYVNLACYQGGALVASGDGAFFEGGGWGQDMTLKSTLWTGGAADCTATLYYLGSKGSVTLASLPVRVDA
jgi:hypothetical protein